MKKKYIYTNEVPVGCMYITPEKRYEVLQEISITMVKVRLDSDAEGQSTFVRLVNSAHLNGGDWIVETEEEAND